MFPLKVRRNSAICDPKLIQILKQIINIYVCHFDKSLTEVSMHVLIRFEQFQGLWTQIPIIYLNGL